MVALQALSEYAIWKNDQTVNLLTTITSSHDRDFSHTVHLHEDNSLLQHTIEVGNSFNGEDGNDNNEIDDDNVGGGGCGGVWGATVVNVVIYEQKNECCHS